jgi:hypothetical protein
MLGRAASRGFLNKLGIWFDTSLTCMGQALEKKGANYTLVSLFSRTPALQNPALLQRLATALDKKKTISPEEIRASDNSLLLFYSKPTALYLPRIRAVDFLAIPAVACLTTTMIPVIILGVFSFFHLPLAVSASRMFVTRMELLPHLEAVLMHKVGYFGLARTELVPIKNLQRMTPQESTFSYYQTWLGGFNRHVMFRDVETKQEYAFEVNGTWMEENLKHELIV